MVLEPGTGQPATGGNPCRASPGASMRTILKLTSTLYDDLVRRLREPHDFAAERVAFLKCRPALSATSLLLLAGGVHHVEDRDYVDDPSAGATISAARAFAKRCRRPIRSMVHVHLHEHRGRPWLQQNGPPGERLVRAGFLECPAQPSSWSGRVQF
jgi:hypothetical protein